MGEREAGDAQAVVSGDAHAPPHNLEAERSVLAAMFNDWEASAVAVEILEAEDFYYQAHSDIFRALKTLHDDDQEVSDLILQERLAAMGRLDAVGGIDAIRNLRDAGISGAFIESHARIVRDNGIRRRIIQETQQTLREAYLPAVPVRELQDGAERRILAVNESAMTETRLLADILTDDYLEDLREIIGGEFAKDALQSDYKRLDELTKGFLPGELVVLAGRTSMGKTTFALNLLVRMVQRNLDPALMVSLEVPAEHIVRNILTMQARVPFHRVGDGRGGDISDDEWEPVYAAASTLESLPIYIDDGSELTLTRLRALARRLKQKKGLRLIVVDYLQLMHESGFSSDNKQGMISAISRGLKGIARELKVVVLALAQLNRQAEEADFPLLSHLRDSGSIEQDADKILLIHRKREETDENRVESLAGPGTKTTIIVAKNRNGPVGKAPLVFLKDIMRFEDYAGFDDEE